MDSKGTAPILRERRVTRIAWTVLAVSSVLVTALFAVLWIVGEVGSDMPLNSALATACWIGIGLFPRFLDFLLGARR